MEIRVLNSLSIKRVCAMILVIALASCVYLVPATMFSKKAMAVDNTVYFYKNFNCVSLQGSRTVGNGFADINYGLSCVKVTSGAQVTLYDGEDYYKAMYTLTLGEGEGDLDRYTYGLNDSAIIGITCVLGVVSTFTTVGTGPFGVPLWLVTVGFGLTSEYNDWNDRADSAWVSPAGWQDDQMSSFSILYGDNAGEVSLARDANGGGVQEKYIAPDRTLVGNRVGSDSATSIYVPSNQVAILYEHINYGGISYQVIGNGTWQNLPSSIDNKASSIVVVNSNCAGVVFHGGFNQTENSHIFYSGQASLPAADLDGSTCNNDAISDIQLVGGAMVYCYKHIYFDTPMGQYSGTG